MLQELVRVIGDGGTTKNLSKLAEVLISTVGLLVGCKRKAVMSDLAIDDSGRGIWRGKARCWRSEEVIGERRQRQPRIDAIR